MRAVGLVCDLRRLKFVHLSERKGVCGANALNFIILSVKNTLNLGILAFLKALSTKSVVNSARGVAWQSTLKLAKRNTAWCGWCFGERCFSGVQAQKTSKTSAFKQSLLAVKAQKDWKFRQALFCVAVKFVSDD